MSRDSMTRARFVELLADEQVVTLARLLCDENVEMEGYQADQRWDGTCLLDSTRAKYLHIAAEALEMMHWLKFEIDGEPPERMYRGGVATTAAGRAGGGDDATR